MTKLAQASLSLLILTLIALAAGVTTSQAQGSGLRSRYVGAVSLEQIAQGAEGVGTLLFYTGQRPDDQPSLVVVFDKPPGSEVAGATVYDVPPGLDYVPVEFGPDTVSFRQALAPALQIVSLDGWWVRDGVISYNLNIEVKGPIYAMWGGGYDPLTASPTSWTALVPHGDPAASIKVRDPQHEGVPLWDLRMLKARVSETRAYYRINYAERTCSSPTQIDYGVSPLWPYIIDGGGYEQTPGRLRPPIVVDFIRGRVTTLSEIVTVRNQNCSASFYSIKGPPGEGGLIHANFETPFAFYDLSGQGNGYPNLILRSEHYPAHDPWSVNSGAEGGAIRTAPREYETIRYSWRNAVGDLRWDYKIEVLGFQPYTFETPIAGGLYTIDAPAYAQFPAWVVDHSWPAVTFIDTEGNSYNSSEGIYDWTPRALGLDYFFGWSDSSTLDAYQEITPGFRGEYRLQKDAPPRLYLSPIDGRLHLKGAEGGLWSLSDGLVMRVYNLTGGDYVDGWVRERAASAPVDKTPADPAVPTATSQPPAAPLSPMPEEAIFALHGYLLYSGPQLAEIRQVRYLPASFEIAPPTDSASWQAFRERMAPFTQQRPDPLNMYSWLDAFSGPTLQIGGGTISGVRATVDGFRFVLTIRPGARVGGENLVSDAPLGPGSYAVTYDGSFTAQPITPPALHVSAPQTGALLGPAIENRPQIVRVNIANNGLSDAERVNVTAVAIDAAGDSRTLGSQQISALSDVNTPVSFSWVPAHPGEWAISVTATVADLPPSAADAASRYEQRVQVVGRALPSTSAALSAFDLIPIPPLLGLMLGLALIAGLSTQRLARAGAAPAPPTQEKPAHEKNS